MWDEMLSWRKLDRKQIQIKKYKFCKNCNSNFSCYIYLFGNILALFSQKISKFFHKNFVVFFRNNFY